MEYIKLIALQVDDFHSSIFFEDNYRLTDINEVNKDKEEIESKGYTCLLAKITSSVMA